MKEVVELVVDDDKIVGREGGFLAIRRMRLRNRHADGGLSRPYLCDFVVRPKGLDAVTIAVYWRDPGSGAVQVLLRDGLRPALRFGRAGAPQPIPDRREYMFLRELCAGIVEVDDCGEQGLRERAAAEVEEEAGFHVDPAAVIVLGAGAFPTPGAMPERYWLTAVRVEDRSAQRPAHGDGSPMEEGSATEWMELDEAISACVAGEIEDLKTELCLRRLRDYLGDLGAGADSSVERARK